MIQFQHKKRFFSAKKLLALAAFMVLLGVVSYLRGPLAGLLWSALGPVESSRAAGGAAAGSFFSFFTSRASLQSRNQALESELAELRIKAADRDILYGENIDLKSRLGRDAGRRIILAGIVARPPATAYDTLIIDAGSAQQLAEGDRVSAGGGTVIGTVSDVYGSTARVALFSSAGSQHDAMLRHGASVLPIRIEGNGAGSLSAKVPAGTEVSAGDAATLPGIAGGFTAQVTHIDAPEGDSFKTLYFHLPVNLFELQYVEILK